MKVPNVQQHQGVTMSYQNPSCTKTRLIVFLLGWLQSALATDTQNYQVSARFIFFPLILISSMQIGKQFLILAHRCVGARAQTLEIALLLTSNTRLAGFAGDGRGSLINST